MITKLTLTIEEAVISSAKKYAGKQGKSLSAIVENFLKSVTAQEEMPKTLSPKVLKLMGVIELPDDFDYKKEMGSALDEKYKG